MEFVSTMPGMTELNSTIVLAETGVDISIFDDAKHLCSWCGLSPANNESAGKKKFVRIANMVGAKSDVVTKKQSSLLQE